MADLFAPSKMDIDALRRDIEDLRTELTRGRPDVRGQDSWPEAVDGAAGLAWLADCPRGERRELRCAVGAVEEVRVVDRRTVDARTLAEHVVGMSLKAREHLAVLLDLLASDGVGGETEVVERTGDGAG